MRRFEIWSVGHCIGETDLEFHDDGMNVYSGRFYPSPEYQNVRSVFKALSAAMDFAGEKGRAAYHEYARMRGDLNLTVRDREGGELPSGAIDIMDFEDALDELNIEVGPPPAKAP
jgi:hypothetical protein